ncbi:MAG: NUDIX hydrolase [Actinomycetia bacterium]|nr:NUDIX hydrolase [Actinomycetes bacterium]
MAARASDRPRVRVAAIIVIADALVLVRQRRSTVPYFLLPGGGVEVGESLGNALVREVAEETGLACRPVRPLFINDTISPDGNRHLINITFLAEQTGGALLAEPVDGSIEAIELVRIADLTELDLRPAIAAEIRHAYEGGFTDSAAYLGPLWTPEDGPS